MSDSTKSATARTSPAEIAAPAPFFELSEAYEGLTTHQARIKAGKSARRKVLKNDEVK